MAQDDKRELAMKRAFDLAEGEGRGGTDAFLKVGRDSLPFELKSSTGNSYSTVRDFGPDHALKWRRHHWLFARFDTSGDKMLTAHYLTPEGMEPWIVQKEAYVLPDFRLAALVPDRLTMDDLHAIVGRETQYGLSHARSLQKAQYSAERYRERMDRPSGYSPERMLEILRERCRYVLERGATLNNPHIDLAYVEKNGSAIPVGKNMGEALRELVATKRKR